MDDLNSRLKALGLTKKEFAAQMGVSPAAVSQWPEIPPHAERLLAELEGGPISLKSEPWEHIPLDSLVRDDRGRQCRVMRRDRCESVMREGGMRETWIYWVSPVKAVPGGFYAVGPTVSMPESFLVLEDVGVQWVEKVDRGKGE